MTTPCNKCNGTGRIEKFGHVESGLCFACMGVGTKLTREERARMIEERQARRDARHEARLARDCGITVEELRRQLNPRDYAMG